MLGHVYPTSVCPCACAVREEKAEHCSAAGQCDQALVISPEGCWQVKASKRGWGGGGWRRGGRGGWILDGWERGKRQRGSWRVCLSIMRNDAAATVNEARVFAPSNEHTDVRLHTHTRNSWRLTAAAPVVNTLTVRFSFQMPYLVNGRFWAESLFF